MVRIGLLFADKGEVPSSVPEINLNQMFAYSVANHDLVAIVSGIGKENVAASVDVLCREFNPDYILSLGICGGAQPDLSIGQLLVADCAHYQGNEIPLQPPWQEQIKADLSSSSFSYRIGKFQMFDDFVTSKKNVLADVIGVDLESYSIADATRKKGVPVVVVKAVSDILPEHISQIHHRILTNDFFFAKKALDGFFSTYLSTL